MHELTRIVGQIVDEECLELGTNATPQFIAALAEFICIQAETLALDLECFATHANRKVIGIDDVKLCARTNEHLENAITTFVNKRNSSILIP